MVRFKVWVSEVYAETLRREYGPCEIEVIEDDPRVGVNLRLTAGVGTTVAAKESLNYWPNVTYYVTYLHDGYQEATVLVLDSADFEIDASPELVEAHKARRQHEDRKAWLAGALRLEEQVHGGDLVEVVRGRKVPVGTIARTGRPFSTEWGESCHLYQADGSGPEPIGRYVPTKNLRKIVGHDRRLALRRYSYRAAGYEVPAEPATVS